MASTKKWQIKEADPKRQKLFAEAFRISTVTAQILLNRGLETLEAAGDFLNPSLKNLPNPFLLPDMKEAVDRLVRAIKNKEPIAVHGDYDIDGLSSAALFITFFRELGIEVASYIPDRIKEGYGVQVEGIEALKSRGTKVLVTADCGSKSYEAVAAAKKAGMDVIVTDHHELGSEPLHAFAFVNPQRLEKKVLGQELAGVGVVFFLLMALRQKMREENLFSVNPHSTQRVREGEAPPPLAEEGATRAPVIAEPNLKQHLDLVVLGTIGDLAPLTGINRVLVSFGLKELAQTTKPGLVALKEVSKLSNAKTLDPTDIGFRLAPRINAGGRIAKASLGLDLLCATDLERARKLAKILDQCNQDRQVMQEKHLKEALEQAKLKETGRGLVVFSASWHPGIVGLVASKLSETYYRPTIALSVEGGLARGSARSIPGVHIVEILGACSDLLKQFGGHKAAAGLTLELANLKDFEARFEKALELNTNEESFIPRLHVDYELKLGEIETQLLEELESLKPFGIKNPEPLFLSRQLKFSEMRIVGEKHLKLRVADLETQMEAIAFNMGNAHPLANTQGDVAFVPQWNHYQDTKTIQLKIKDLKQC